MNIRQIRSCLTALSMQVITKSILVALALLGLVAVFRLAIFAGFRASDDSFGIPIPIPVGQLRTPGVAERAEPNTPMVARFDAAPEPIAFRAPPTRSTESPAAAAFVPVGETDRRQLDLNPQFADFLAHDHAIPSSAAKTERHDWVWEDDRPQLTWNGCEPEYIDRRLPALSCEVHLELDLTRIEAIERHFGLDSAAQPKEFWSTTSNDMDSQDRLLSARDRALESHGVISTEQTVGPDHNWLVSTSMPLLRPLAEEIVRQWRTIHVGPQYGRTLEALTSFVQRGIPYVAIGANGDGRERFDLRSPALTALQGGDCDSKSVLLAALIRCIDPEIPIVLVELKASDGSDGHMMIAVGLPPLECSEVVGYNGQRYVMIEATDGWGIGRVGDVFRSRKISRIVEIVPLGGRMLGSAPHSSVVGLRAVGMHVEEIRRADDQPAA